MDHCKMALHDHFPTTRWLIGSLIGQTSRIVLASLLTLLLVLVIALRISTTLAQTQAESLLADIRSLQIDKSTFEQARAIAEKYGKAVDFEDGVCTPEQCDYTVWLGYSWTAFAYDWKLLHRALDLMGCRPWMISAGVYIQNRRVRGFSYNATIGVGDRSWLVGGARTVPGFLAFEAGAESLNQSPNYQVRKPNLTTPGGGLVLLADFTYEAREPEIRRALNFRLNCLSSLTGCTQLAELMPSAWEDYLEQRAREEYLRGKPVNCTNKTLTRLARDVKNILLVEVERIQSYEGDWDQPRLQYVDYKLVRSLKGAPDRPLEHFPHDVHKGSLTADPLRPRLSPALSSPGKQLVLFLEHPHFIPDPDCGVVRAEKSSLALLERAISKYRARNELTSGAASPER